MTKAKKSPFTMGRVLISIGTILRIFQIIGTYLHWEFASKAILSACMLCFFVGGLCVFAYERRGYATLWALLCALCSLISTFMLSITELSAFVNFLSIALYFFTFASFGGLVFSLGKPLQKIVGILIILLGSVLILPVAGIVLSKELLLILLIGTWALMGISIYLDAVTADR